MIINLSNKIFREIFKDEQFFLPIRWNGVNYVETIEDLYEKYLTKLNKYVASVKPNEHIVDIKTIKSSCGLITNSIKEYLNGFPSKAYNQFEKLMKVLTRYPLKTNYNQQSNQADIPKSLFRVVCVDDLAPYNRARLFHTPYNLRSRVATCRYSIAGYPSLYLGTSIALCCEEIHHNPFSKYALASRFEVEENQNYSNIEINIIDLSVKPQFFFEELYDDVNYNKNYYNILYSLPTMNAYLLWYPLISACSYIRTNKSNPFAAEYIIPQLLMQWIRIEMSKAENDENDKLIGIKYFSCSSIKASNMGFNYVFPTSGVQYSSDYPYCPVLMQTFRLTSPQFIHEYKDLNDCEMRLINDKELKFINK